MNNRTKISFCGIFPFANRGRCAHGCGQAWAVITSVKFNFDGTMYARVTTISCLRERCPRSARSHQAWPKLHKLLDKFVKIKQVQYTKIGFKSKMTNFPLEGTYRSMKLFLWYASVPSFAPSSETRPRGKRGIVGHQTYFKRQHFFSEGLTEFHEFLRIFVRALKRSDLSCAWNDNNNLSSSNRVLGSAVPTSLLELCGVFLCFALLYQEHPSPNCHIAKQMPTYCCEGTPQ